MKKKIYLFVDDDRMSMFDKIGFETANTDIYCYWCKTYDSAISRIKFHAENNDSIILDLDHDLGEGKTGYDIAKYVVENQIPLYCFKCHSMNPVGRKNIEQLLIHYGYKKEI